MQKISPRRVLWQRVEKEHLDVISCWIERATDGSPGEGISRTLQIGAAERRSWERGADNQIKTRLYLTWHMLLQHKVLVESWFCLFHLWAALQNSRISSFIPLAPLFGHILVMQFLPFLAFSFCWTWNDFSDPGATEKSWQLSATSKHTITF